MEAGREFDSTEEFKEALRQFCQSNHVVYTITDSKKVTSVNKHVKKKYDADKFQYTFLRYECKNGPKNKKKKTKGHGLRPNQRTFDTGCPAMLTAAIDKEKNTFVIQVHKTVHNHELSRELFKQYPEQRRCMEGELVDSTKTMLKMGVKVKVLQDYLRAEKLHFLSVKDLHNMRQKMKSDISGSLTDEDILLKELEDIVDEDPDSSVSVRTDDNGTLQALLLVTGQMKRTFDKFSEVLFVDGTYCTNKLRLPLYTFLVEDGNGCGQPVGYCFVADEKRSTIQLALNEFGKCVNLENVQVVIVDKDLNEIASIQASMPHVSIQICKFHVLQAITREVRKVAIPEEERKLLLTCCRSLVYSRTEKKFEERLAHLSRIAPRDFMAYYNKNWHSVKQLWAAYLTDNHINLGNTTNNRTESHNHKIKEILSRNMNIAEAVKGLILLNNAKLLATNHENFNQEMKTSYRLGDNDLVTRQVLETLTPYAARIVLDEMKHARKNTEQLSVSSQLCSCLIQRTCLLPCRHLFARRIQNEETIFQRSDAAKRWHIAYQQNQNMSIKRNAADTEEETSGNITLKRKKHAVKTRQQKYKEALSEFKTMAEFLSERGTAEFIQKLAAVKELYNIWLNGENAVVLCSSNIQKPVTEVEKEEEKSEVVSDEDTVAMPYNILNEELTELIDDDEDSKAVTNEVQNKEEAKKPSIDRNEDIPNFGIADDNTTATSSNYTEDSGIGDSVLGNEPKSPVFKRKLCRRLSQCNSPVNNEETKEEKGEGSAKKDVIFCDKKIFKLPKSPPVRGKSRIKKIKKSSQSQEKENVLDARRRILTKNSKQKKVQTPKDYMSTIENLENMRHEINNNTVQLTDRHINICNMLLKKKYPKICGLQDPVLGQKLQFDLCPRTFIQILHNGSGHWLTVANMTGEPGVVDIYDSLYDTVNTSTKMQIASIMCTSEIKITCRMMRFQKQKGGIDCGLFAVAAAVALCSGADPSDLQFHQNLMRNHLCTCLEKQDILPFPCTQLNNNVDRVKRSLKVPLYCSCRLPDNYQERMLECSVCNGWFHQTCMSIKREIFSNKTLSDKWTCRNCK